MSDGAEFVLNGHHPHRDLHDPIEGVDLLMDERCSGFVGRPVRDAGVEPFAERFGLCEYRPHIEQGRVVEMAIVERVELRTRFYELLDGRSLGSGARRYSRKRRVRSDTGTLTHRESGAVVTADGEAVPSSSPALAPLAVAPRTCLAPQSSVRVSARRCKPRLESHARARTS